MDRLIHFALNIPNLNDVRKLRSYDALCPT